MSTVIGSAIDGLDPVTRALQELRHRVENLEARQSRTEDAVAAVTPAPTAPSQTPVTAPPSSPWAAPRLMPSAPLADTANLDRHVVAPPPVAAEALPASPTSHGYGATRHGAVGPIISTPSRRSES